MSKVEDTNKTISKTTSLNDFCHCGLSAILLSERFPTSGNDIQCDLTYELLSNYENETICIKFCGVCPTYPGVKGELLFCARGKSSSPKQKTGCNCGLCDVWNKYDLTIFTIVLKEQQNNKRREVQTKYG